MKCRVMMVDDNDNDLLFTRLMLERSGAGFEVIGFERAAARELLAERAEQIEAMFDLPARKWLRLLKPLTK